MEKIVIRSEVIYNANREVCPICAQRKSIRSRICSSCNKKFGAKAVSAVEAVITGLSNIEKAKNSNLFELPGETIFGPILTCFYFRQDCRLSLIDGSNKAFYEFGQPVAGGILKARVYNAFDPDIGKLITGFIELKLKLCLDGITPFLRFEKIPEVDTNTMFVERFHNETADFMPELPHYSYHYLNNTSNGRKWQFTIGLVTKESYIKNYILGAG